MHLTDRAGGTDGLAGPSGVRSGQGRPGPGPPWRGRGRAGINVWPNKTAAQTWYLAQSHDEL